MKSPVFAFPVLENPAPNLSICDAEKIAEQWVDSPKNIKYLASERDQNFYIESSNNERFVLKIANSKESFNTLDFQNKALKHLSNNSELSLPRVKCNLSGSDIVAVKMHNQKFLVRLVSFVDGKPLGDINSPKNIQKLYSNMGSFLGSLGKGLKNFKHSSSKHKLLWDMSHTHLLYELLPFIKNKHNKSMAHKALLYFTDHVEKPLAKLRTQVIHNDMNSDNVILVSSGSSEVAGMIDFGDMVEAPLINDLAVAAAYQTAAMNDIFKGTSSLLSGYHQAYPLLPKELDLLPGLIMNRVAMSAIICEWRAIDHPDNQEYILGGIQRMWKTLEALLKSDLEGVSTTLKNNLTPVVD